MFIHTERGTIPYIEAQYFIVPANQGKPSAKKSDNCTMGDGGWVNSPLLYKPQPKWADLSGPQWDPIFGPNPRYGPQGPFGQKIYLTFHPFRE